MFTFYSLLLFLLHKNKEMLAIILSFKLFPNWLKLKQLGWHTRSCFIAWGHLVRKYIANNIVLAVVSFPAKRRLMMKSATASSGKFSSSTSLPNTPFPISPAPSCFRSLIVLRILLMIIFLAFSTKMIWHEKVSLDRWHTPIYIYIGMHENTVLFMHFSIHTFIAEW